MVAGDAANSQDPAPPLYIQCIHLEKLGNWAKSLLQTLYLGDFHNMGIAIAEAYG